MTALQLDLFDLGQARRNRDAAIDAAEANADADWRDEALATVYRVCLTHAFFASDNVWQAGLAKPHEARALGPVMMRAVREGYCRRTDQTRPTTNVSQHAQPIRLYESCIYQAASSPLLPRPSLDSGPSEEGAGSVS